MTHIGYLVHDLSDAAVGRRLSMLHAGGATVALAGLLREGRPVPSLQRVTGEPAPLVLGEGGDAKLAQRALLIASILAKDLDRLASHVAHADILIARNLEMLAVAARLAARMKTRPRLVYECLDIHRLLTSKGPAGTVMRAIERRAGRSVDMVMTSSPAFVENHLAPAGFGNRVHLVENKVLDLPGAPPPAAQTDPGPPWRIGWFGALRCRQTFDVLSDLARRCDGAVEIVIRGRPSEAIFPDLAAEARDVPHLRFGGAYDYATELGAIYEQVHFAWCIDFYEKGANSSWLLPNRLYESVFHNTVPIALSGVETGRYLQRMSIGETIKDADSQTLMNVFEKMTPATYTELLARQQALPRDHWSVGTKDCVDLVDALAGRQQATARAAS